MAAPGIARVYFVASSPAYVRLDPLQRREIVAELPAEGMSGRQIASGLGVDQKTVANDLKASEEKSSPAPVVDPEPTPAPRR